MMRVALQRLGLPGCLGFIMLAGAVWAHVSWLPEQRQSADLLGSQARQLRSDLANQVAQASTEAIRTPLPADAAWQQLRESLPDATHRLALQSAVLESAAQAGVQVASIQYRGRADDAASLWHQQMVMPVQGSYPAVKAWLMRVLTQPAVSLDGVDIQRDDVMSDVVKARVSLSLWWRPDDHQEAAP